ncbi:MAG TPA: SRPBCC family protein [Acidimicrobiales bacterium]|nr:SRPBCC family protein [Acidimicrobiales bacterium]
MIENESVRVDVMIDADVDQVWAVVSDPSMPAAFSEEFVGAEWLDDVAVGARFVGKNQRGDYAWSTTCTMTEYDPPRAFIYVVEDLDDPVATWGFRLSQEEDAVRLTMVATMGPGESPPRTAAAKDPDNAASIIARRLATLERNMVATVEGVKQRCEN